MRRLGSVVALGILSACGGGSSPTAPPVVTLAPAPVTPTTRDGVTGAAVTATIAGTTTVTATASGYLAREQPAAPVLWLWPQASEYVQATVYTNGFGAAHSLYRWAPGSTLRLAFVAGLGRYDGLLAEMAAEVSGVSRLGVIALPAGDSSANVTFRVDGDGLGTNLAQTSLSFSGNTITRGFVQFASETNITGGFRNNTLLHELGHVMGLGHSPDPGDVMSVATNRRNERSFGDPERRALVMMYSWRKAGNQFPDREPVGLQSTARTTVTIVCER